MTVEKMRLYLSSWFEVLFENTDVEEIMETVMFRKNFRRCFFEETDYSRIHGYYNPDAHIKVTLCYDREHDNLWDYYLVKEM